MVDGEEVSRVYRGWIGLICKKHKVRPTNIALRIGRSPSTITRQIRMGHKHQPQLQVILDIASEFDEPIPTELFGTSIEKKSQRSATEIADSFVEDWRIELRELKMRMTSGQEGLAITNRRLDRLEEKISDILILLQEIEKSDPK